MVRLISLPDISRRVRNKPGDVSGVTVQFKTTSSPIFNEFCWHLAQEGGPVPLDDPRSYNLHSNSHAAPQPAFILACGRMPSDLLNDCALSSTH